MGSIFQEIDNYFDNFVSHETQGTMFYEVGQDINSVISGSPVGMTYHFL